MAKYIYIYLALAICWTSTYGQSGISPDIIDSINQQAHVYLSLNPDSSKVLALYTYSEAINKEYKKGQADALMILGNYHRILTNYDESQELLQKALAIRKELNDTKGISGAYSALGSTILNYSDIAKSDSLKSLFTRAETFFKLDYEICIGNKDTVGLIKNKNQYGLLNSFQNNIDKSIDYLKQGLELAHLIEDSMLIVKCSQNLAGLYIDKGNLYDSSIYFDSSLLYTKNALQYKCSECRALSVTTHINSGVAYFMTANDDSALLHYNLAEEQAKELELPKALKVIYSNKADYYDYHEDYLNASTYYSKYATLSDSINNYRKLQLFATAQEKFHTQEKEEETAAAERKLQIGTLVGGIIALFLLALMVTYRQKKRIAEQKKTLADQQIKVVLKEQESKKLEAMIVGQENERKRIAADLHDRIGSLLSTAKLQFSSVEDTLKAAPKGQEQYTKTVQLLDEATTEVRRISHNLSTGIVAKFGLIAALEEMQRTITSTGKLDVELTHSGLDDRLSSDIEISLYRIIQELLNNTLKHAGAKEMHINLTHMGNEINAVIEDDGKGFSKADEAGGIGFHNIRQRLKSIDGQLHIDSTLSKGTTIIIEIPM